LLETRVSKGGGCPEKQCRQGYKSAADKTYTAGGYGFLSKRPCLRRPNTRIPATTEARTNTACTLRRRRSVVPIPSVFADNPLSRPHAICRGWWRQVNSPNCNCFGASSADKMVLPVTFAPGRLRLATRPNAIGSAPVTKTIGMVVVAAFAASDERSAWATITATRRRTRSAASAGSRSF
jgi:hypothetical protein